LELQKRFTTTVPNFFELYTAHKENTRVGVQY